MPELGGLLWRCPPACGAVQCSAWCLPPCPRSLPQPDSFFCFSWAQDQNQMHWNCYSFRKNVWCFIKTNVFIPCLWLSSNISTCPDRFWIPSLPDGAQGSPRQACVRQSQEEAARNCPSLNIGYVNSYSAAILYFLVTGTSFVWTWEDWLAFIDLRFQYFSFEKSWNHLNFFSTAWLTTFYCPDQRPLRIRIMLDLLTSHRSRNYVEFTDWSHENYSLWKHIILM